MGFFGLFKKKDDFDSVLKDPLSDPFGKMPGMPENENPYQSNQGGLDIPSDDPFSQQRNDNAMGGGGFSSPISPNNYNTSANALPQMQNNNFEQTYAQRRNKGPESYEEMGLQNHTLPQRGPEPAFDKKDFEIINLKLDTIKSQLENLSQRIATLEKKPFEEETPRPRRYNW